MFGRGRCMHVAERIAAAGNSSLAEMLTAITANARWAHRQNRRGTVMNRFVIAFGCVLLAGPALAQSAGEKTGVNSVLGISPTTPDFVKEVATSDMFEIQSSTLAQDKGNAAAKSFAGQMIADHTKTSTELKQLVSSGKVQADVPTVLDS